MASNYPPKKNVAFTMYFYMMKSDGTVIANPTLTGSNVHVDGNTTEVTNSTLAVVDTTTGLCSIALAQATMNGDQIDGTITSSSTGAVVYPFKLMTSAYTNDEIGAAIADLDTEMDAQGVMLANIHDTDLPAVKTDTGNTYTDVHTTLLGRILGTLAAGTHSPQSGDTFNVVKAGGTGDNAAILAFGAPPSASTITTAVWGAATRSLTTFGTLVADIATAVWGATTRTLSAFGFTPNVGNVTGTLPDVQLAASQDHITPYSGTPPTPPAASAIASQTRTELATELADIVALALVKPEHTPTVDSDGKVVVSNVPAAPTFTGTVSPPDFAGTVEFTGTVEAPAIDPADLISAGLAMTGEAATAAQTVITHGDGVGAWGAAGLTPDGYVRITQATLGTDDSAIGTLLPGTLVYAYASADTAHAAPVCDPATADVIGDWALDVPQGDTYALVALYPRKHNVTAEVTV